MADPKVNLFGPSTKDDIKVGYISTTRGYVTGVGVNDANIYAKKDPGTTFILQNRDYIKYLNINEVNALTPEVLEATGEECKGVEWDAPVETPEVIFSGGGGVGVVGNPVFGTDGALLAVDLVSGGFGYKYAPTTKLRDVSGGSAGAHLISIVGNIPDSEIVYDKREDFEDYIINEDNVVGIGSWYGPDGKVIGQWDPSLYLGDEEPSFDTITDNYIKKLKEFSTSGIGGVGPDRDKDPGAGIFWWAAKDAPKLVAGNGKTTRKIYKVEHVAWNETPPPTDSEGNVTDWSTNGWLNTHAISPIPMSHAKGSAQAGELFSLEWDVNFPWDGEYSFRGSADNHAIVYFDNEELTTYKLGSGGAAGKVLSLPTIVKKEVTEGTHTIRIDLKNSEIKKSKKVQASSKTYGSLLQLEDLPNVAAEDQGGVTYDDLQCYAKIGRFFDINANKAKYKVDPSLNQPEGSELEVEYKVTTSSAFVNKIVVKDLFTEQGPEVVQGEPTLPEISQRKASATFTSRGSGKTTEYYMTVVGNDLLDIQLEFRKHRDDSIRGGGSSVESIIIQSEDGPIRLLTGPVSPDAAWPFDDAMITVKKGTFKNDKEYRVTFTGARFQQTLTAGLISQGFTDATPPQVFNNGQGIAFYDSDTSDGATAGPDLDGDVRAQFNVINIEQLSDSVPSIPGDLNTKQLNKTFKKTVIVGKVYPVTVSNAGQGLMGNFPAPIGALKAVDVVNQDVQNKNNSETSVEKTKVFNTTDYITSANRKLWRTNVNNRGGFINEYGVCPFNTKDTLPDNPYAGTHTIRWNNINFPISGNYTIRVGVDDNVDLKIGTSRGGDVVTISKKGYTVSKKKGIKSTGVGTYVRYIEAGRYSIEANLTQIPGGKFGFGKIQKDGAIHDYSGQGLNPMVLAVAIDTTVADVEEVVPQSWHGNPMGVGLNIKAPLPPAPQQPIPVQEGRCPSNPIWSTRFPNSKNGTWYPVRFGSWTEFHNKYGMSPVPPLSTSGTDNGGVAFTNSWDVDIPYKGWYKLKALIDDIGTISIDGEVKLNLGNRNKVENAESLFYLTEGMKEVKVEIENNSTRITKLIDQKVFNTKDWININPIAGGAIQKDVQFKVATNSAFINSITIKGLLYEQGGKWESTTRTETELITGATIPPEIAFIKRDSKYYLRAFGNKRVQAKFDFRSVGPIFRGPVPQEIPTTMEFIKRNDKYYLKVTGNRLVDVGLEFRYHEDDPNRGGGDSVTSITINTENAPLTFTKSDGPHVLLDGWPFRGGRVRQNATFLNGKEYEVTFDRLAGAPNPIIGPAGSLDNTSTDKPNQRINFFDNDTSAGATPGPDLFGDVTAYFTATSISQLSPVPARVAEPAAIQSINIQTMDAPIRFNVGETTTLPDWPFSGSSEVKNAIFENGKEYEVTFTGLIDGVTAPEISSGGATDNSDTNKPNQRICIYDLDTSAGATPGPDLDGDVRAHFTALNVIQLDEPESVEKEISIDDRKLVQVNSTIVKDVEIGKVYDVEIKNAGQGLMGNTSAPLADLKVQGGVLMVEDIPNFDEGAKGGITHDDLVCSVSGGRFFDINKNTCKFIIDAPKTGTAQRYGVTYNGPSLSTYGSYEGFGPLITPTWTSDEEYIRTHNGTTWVMTFTGVDFPETGDYDIKGVVDDNIVVKIDGQEIITVEGSKGVQKKRFNVNKGKRNLELILSNKDFGATYWKNPVVAGISITRKVDVYAGTPDASKSWMENPISISAELIPPPCPRKVKGGGVIEEVIVLDPGNGPPSIKTPEDPEIGYPVIVKLDKVIVNDPGINHNCGEDKIVVEPNNGVELSYKCDNFGRIKEVIVDNPGNGFTDYPQIYMDSPTGVGAEFLPVMSTTRDPRPADPDIDPDKLLQVTDLVGVKQTGYYDGRPYYGAVFYKEGVRYAGYYETTGVLVQIYDTLQESIDGIVTTPPSAIQRQGTDISSDDTNLDIPNTPDNLY